MMIETDIVENELRNVPSLIQDKTRVVLRSVFQESFDLKEAEAILAVVDNVIKKAAKKIDTKEFIKRTESLPHLNHRKQS